MADEAPGTPTRRHPARGGSRHAPDILGDAYVDAQASDPNETMREFQDQITSSAWGAWAEVGR